MHIELYSSSSRSSDGQRMEGWKDGWTDGRKDVGNVGSDEGEKGRDGKGNSGIEMEGEKEEG